MHKKYNAGSKLQNLMHLLHFEETSETLEFYMYIYTYDWMYSYCII